MTATAAPTFRKTKTGEWVAFGPVSQLHIGALNVTKRDGTVKPVWIKRIGKTFRVDGVECAYGYIDDHRARARSGNGRGPCSECGHWGPIGRRCNECYEGSHSH